MKKTKLLFIASFLLWLVGCGQPATYLAAIYDRHDDRKDYYELNPDQKLQLSSSIKIVQKRDYDAARGILKTLSLSETVKKNLGTPLCETERFHDQPSVPGCTGFFVGEDLVVTAGHCMSRKVCQNSYIVFDYRLDEPKTNAIEVHSNQVYQCREVISRQQRGDIEVDYAIIRLDRQVLDRQPLKLRRQGLLDHGTSVAALGYPNGVPAKYTGNGRIFQVKENFFTTYVDIFGGNSGSAVINERTGLVEGIVSHGGSPDYVKSGNCMVANTPRFGGLVVMSSVSHFRGHVNNLLKP